MQRISIALPAGARVSSHDRAVAVSRLFALQAIKTGHHQVSGLFCARRQEMTAVFSADDAAPSINAARITRGGGCSVLYHD